MGLNTGSTSAPYTVAASTNYCPMTSKLNGFRFITSGGGSGTFYSNNIAGLTGICTSAPCVSGEPMASTCQCPAGKVPSGASCVACGVGSYAPTVGSTACTACTNGQGSAGSTSVAYTVATDTSLSTCPFVCNYGYGYNSATGLCEACDQGQYASAQAKLDILFCLFDMLNFFPQAKNACSQCGAGAYAGSTAQSVCQSCPPGTYSSSAGAIACQDCTYTPPAPGSGLYVQPCTSTANYMPVNCPACGVGQTLSCTPTLYASPPVCTSCAAGTYQATSFAAGTAYPPSCSNCNPGFYTSLTGQARCFICSNSAPANGVYAAWTVPATSATCPISCNAGYAPQVQNGVTVCSLCGKGYYKSAGATVCSQCTGAGANMVNAGLAYWLTPVLFNESWNGCPWDCVVGYAPNAARTSCVQCIAGQTFNLQAGKPTADNSPLYPSACSACGTCGAGSYVASACTVSQNTQCSPCSGNCPAGKYIVPCTATADRVCVACKTTCNAGFYMSGVCDGTGSADTISCVACASPGICPANTFMPAGQCPGNGAADAQCRY